MTELRSRVESHLASRDVQVGGPRAWDIQVHDERFFGRLVRDGSLGLGESYVEGWWDCPAVDQLFDRLGRGSTNKPTRSLARSLMRLRSKLTNLQSRARARQVIERHYDLPVGLYERMLDANMQYSCAWFEGTQDLGQAQRLKLELIARKLDLKEGQQVLEIGSGFGGLARHLAQEHGVRVRATNLSGEQMAFARRFNAGLPVEIIEEDYRDTRGRYERIVSIAMLEAVGRRNYTAYFERVHQALQDDGVFVLHTIGDNRSRPHVDRWILEYIFPNGELPSPGELGQEIEGRFVLEDWHNLGPHYDPTLMAWARNFEQAWPEIQALDERFDERFRRLWRYYLLSSAGNFRARNVQLWQLVLTKHKSGTIWQGSR